MCYTREQQLWLPAQELHSIKPIDILACSGKGFISPSALTKELWIINGFQKEEKVVLLLFYWFVLICF